MSGIIRHCHSQRHERRRTMAKPIELETTLKGEEARAFNDYVSAPSQSFNKESLDLFREARQLRKDWHR